MKPRYVQGTTHTAAANKKTTVFEEQVARDWRRFKEKYFACTEYPAVRRALRKILTAEEKTVNTTGRGVVASKQVMQREKHEQVRP